MGGAQSSRNTPLATVTYLPNRIAQGQKYKAVDCESIRFCDIVAYQREKNQYIFTMSLRNEIDIRECIPVLNDVVHCIAKQNYQVNIGSKAIVDIFDHRLQSTLFECQNPKSKQYFSMKIVPFKSYNSIEFKKAFYELYLNKQVGYRNNVTAQLLDYYIYGVNSQSQAFVFLFEKLDTSLSNVCEYRLASGLQYTDKQKLQLAIQILQSYEALYNKNIIHRDVRPSNVYFSKQKGGFVLGNLSRARLMRRNYQSDLMSVCGVPEYSCFQMQNLMKDRACIGSYDGIKQDYAGLMSILRILETCDVYDNNPQFYCKQLGQIYSLLAKQQDFRAIMQTVRKIQTQKSIDKSEEIGDQQISQTCSFLLAHTHKEKIQNYVFQIYGHLGYYKKYSDKAHAILQKNNENGKQLQNAPILTHLGNFYESKGTKGTQYFYNSFVLYLSRADNQIRYGYPEKAQNQLTCAQEVYFKFNRVIESQLPRIEIKRISSLLDLQKANLTDSTRTINDTFIMAAKNNIPVQKQCKILLAYGKIYQVKEETRAEALKKLETGLAICENLNSFETPAECRVFKSRFLKQIANAQIRTLLKMKDPLKKDKSVDSTLKGQIQANLKTALEIQERENVDDLDIGETLESFGLIYYNDHKYYDAKDYYSKAYLRFLHIKQSINPQKIINVLYMRGSCHYYLQEYKQAKVDYEQCLGYLDKMPKTQKNLQLTYNIEGNKGLALLRLGNSEGRTIIEEALGKIANLKGENSYDYASLNHHYRKIIS